MLKQNVVYNLLQEILDRVYFIIDISKDEHDPCEQLAQIYEHSLQLEEEFTYLKKLLEGRKS